MNITSTKRTLLASLGFLASCICEAGLLAQEPTHTDYAKELQRVAWSRGVAEWGHWGLDPLKYSSWTSHSNRLVPVYLFGGTLSEYLPEPSPYTSPDRLQKIYSYVPAGTVNAEAKYRDQTDIYEMQVAALAKGKKNIILVVFDGMDWQTTQNAAIYKTRRIPYTEGRGTGLHILDYRAPEKDKPTNDYFWMVTSSYGVEPENKEGLPKRVDPDAQTVQTPDATGGYDATLGGDTPWAIPSVPEYLIGRYRPRPHNYTDSAPSASSMTNGTKSYNGSINVSPHGEQIETLVHRLQRDNGKLVGVVTSVPISHATPAAAYGHNVQRDDYQDLSRDMLGLPSASHRVPKYPGLDLVLGAGHSVVADKDEPQGANFVPGNRYLTAADQKAIDIKNGGSYVVAERQSNQKGSEVLEAGLKVANERGAKLFGFFGAKKGHLPYQTADGRFDPVRGVNDVEVYSEADIVENPTLAEMTDVALRYLERDPDGFWLMVEPGDVDWANHDSNIDNSIGAVISGDNAVKTITDWITARDAWDETLLIVTADHGHYFFLREPEVLTGAVAK